MTTTYTLEEVKKHNSVGDLWVIIDGRVYDITPFLEDHPGGDGVLMDNAGTDATSEFNAVGHSDEAKELLVQYYKGDLAGATPKAALPQPKPKAAATKPATSASTTSTPAKASSTSTSNPAPGGSTPVWKQLIIPAAIVAIGLGVRFYYG